MEANTFSQLYHMPRFCKLLLHLVAELIYFLHVHEEAFLLHIAANNSSQSPT